VIQYIFFLLIFFSAFPFAYAGSDHDLIVQRTMDCMESYGEQKDGITWNDVCNLGASYPVHIKIVNEQMDQVEASKNPNPPPRSLSKKADISFSPQTPRTVYKIAPEVSYIKYTEPGLMKESGMMFGVNVVSTLHPYPDDDLKSLISHIDMYRFEGRLAYGKVNYRGGTVDINTGNVTPAAFNGINDYMGEIRLLAGKDFAYQPAKMTPYIGFGYRHLFDGLRAFKPAGYDRRIQYFYVPMGADFAFSLAQGWSLETNLEYDYFIRGIVHSYLGQIGFGNLENQQTSGYGLRGALRLLKNSGPFNFLLEPYVRYWHIYDSKESQSDVFSFGGSQYVLIGIEPNNTSLEMGIKLGVEF
jgi:hypothetical protein